MATSSPLGLHHSEEGWVNLHTRPRILLGGKGQELHLPLQSLEWKGICWGWPGVARTFNSLAENYSKVSRGGLTIGKGESGFVTWV